MTPEQRELLDHTLRLMETRGQSVQADVMRALRACLAQLDSAERVVEAAKAVARADGIAVVGAKQKQAWASRGRLVGRRVAKLHESVDAYDKIKEQGLCGADGDTSPRLDGAWIEPRKPAKGKL